MDLGTLIGFVVAIVIILAAILLGGSILLFIDVPSIFIVFGGTIGVTLIKFKMSSLVETFALSFKSVFFESQESPREIVQVATQVAQIVQRDGLLALENFEIKNPFFKKGIRLCVDGLSPEFIQSVLNNEMRLESDKLSSGEQIMRAMADSGPGMGMVGTLIGLVQMLANMSDPSAIGPAMAVALLTTLYGSLLAQVMCLPIADKLAMRNKNLKDTIAMIMDGVAGIQAGQTPRVLQELLETYLPENQRGDGK